MKRLALLLLLPLLTAFSCNVSGRRVLFVGDSQTAMNANVFAGYLFGGYGQGGAWKTPAPAFLPTFAAVPGARLLDSADWAATLATVEPDYDAVVLELGQNDAIAGSCTAGLDAHIDEVVAALPAGIPVVWLDAPYVPSAMYSQSCLVQVNLALQAAYWRHYPRIVYVNTNAVLAGVPASQRWLADGVHWSQTSAYTIAEAVMVELEGLL